MGRFIIKGFHPESDDEWTEPESFTTAEQAFEYIDGCPEIDNGHGHYEVWDTYTNQEVQFSGKGNIT